MGHIGDCHSNDKAINIVGIIIGNGKTRVIVIARISGVNRDQWHIAPIFAPFGPCGGLSVGVINHVLRKIIRNAVLMDCNQ